MANPELGGPSLHQAVRLTGFTPQTNQSSTLIRSTRPTLNRNTAFKDPLKQRELPDLSSRSTNKLRELAIEAMRTGDSVRNCAGSSRRCVKASSDQRRFVSIWKPRLIGCLGPIPLFFVGRRSFNYKQNTQLVTSRYKSFF